MRWRVIGIVALGVLGCGPAVRQPAGVMAATAPGVSRPGPAQRLALVLVIDRSGSMSGEPLIAARDSALASVEVLRPDDLVAVLAFDNRVGTYVELQPAGQRQAIRRDLMRLQPGGGTNILPGLQAARAVLKTADAAFKHVIVLSDGQAAYDGIVELCDEMRAGGITLSAVGFGDADENLLRLISDHGGGRYYFTRRPDELVPIFRRDTAVAVQAARTP